ncbi:MAG: asparaginase [Cyclobacteriaceae bacterium]|nr:asparaginase [Cyclobacteriaceae bacterium]
MNYNKININTALPASPKAKVMIIYTGGTLGMTHNANGVLIPFDFNHILEHLPTLRNLLLDITVIAFEDPIDSSNIEPAHWQTLGKIIFENYEDQDGFVVLHGTDTMAYTSSALSFMCKGLAKPVIFTGAQLPISEPRSDARENLITALEIASAKINGKPIVPEVCIYFDYELIRGCRAKKVESMHFDAFQSENYPSLAKAGVKIDYATEAIRVPLDDKLSIQSQFDTNVALIKLFPGISAAAIKAVVTTPGLKALVMETFGSGNAPSASWFLDILKKAISDNVLILNISQCPGGMVTQGKYETSKALEEIGVISGADMTTESAVTKLMLLLGEGGIAYARKWIGRSLAGELTED